MDILALVLACVLGFGIACVIFSFILAKSNDIGNSVGFASQYTIGISYDISKDKLSDDEIDSFGYGYIRNEDRNRDNEPDFDKEVERSLQLNEDNHGWNSKFIR